MSDEWDQYAPTWDGDPLARAYATAAFASLDELVDAMGSTLEGADILDFGCGTGLLTEHLVATGGTIDAVDTSSGMLDVLDAKIERHGWTTVRTGTALPDGAGRFDLVVCSSVCAFLDDYPTAVADLVSRLRPGGLFVQWDWERTADDDPGLSRDQIRRTLTTAGLTDVDVRTAFTIDVDGHTLAPLMGRGRRPRSRSAT